MAVTDHPTALRGGDPITRELPLIFADAYVHKDMADMASNILHREIYGSLTIRREVQCVAAGFLSSLGVDVGCYGKSESLGIKSRGKIDDALILMLDYSHGIRS